MSVIQQVVAHLRAGRWEVAHREVQRDASPLTAWLHGIVHLQEGDLEDAEYWYGLGQQNFRNRGTWQQELARLEAAIAQPAAEQAKGE
jgi:hypothetical protein